MNTSRFIVSPRPQNALQVAKLAMNEAFEKWSRLEIIRLQEEIAGYESKLQRLRPRLIAEAERTGLDERFRCLFGVSQQWTRNLSNATERYTALNLLKDGARVQIDDILQSNARAWERFYEVPEHKALCDAYTKERDSRLARRDERASLMECLRAEGLI